MIHPRRVRLARHESHSEAPPLTVEPVGGGSALLGWQYLSPTLRARRDVPNGTRADLTHVHEFGPFEPSREVAIQGRRHADRWIFQIPSRRT